MDPSAASTVLHSITAAGAIAWIAGVAFVRRQAATTPDDKLDVAADAPPPDFAGSLQVAGSPEELCPRAAGALAVAGQPGLGPVKILQSGAERLVFEVHSAQSAGRVVQRAEFGFRSVGGGRTEIRWSGRMASGSGLLVAARVALVLGLLALVAGAILLRTFVVDSPDPAIRVQVWQMVQCVHFLWPPFLFAGLHGARRRQVQRWLELLVHNLPHRLPHQRPAP